MNNILVPFEVDTSAAVSIMSQFIRTIFTSVKLNSTEIGLQTYTAEPVKVLGEAQVQVIYGEYKGTLMLYVVEGAGPNLMG